MSEIKLPPVPTSDVCAVGYRIGDMRAYARQAIELDRQGRGEPVAWYSKQYGVVWMKTKPGNLVKGTKWFIEGRPEPVAECTSTVSLVWHIATSGIEHGTVFYSAPQPAEPVKEPNDEEIVSAVVDYWNACSHPNTTISEREMRLHGIRALLARYRSAAQPYKDSTPELHVGDSSFESWFCSYNPAGLSSKQQARDAYSAGMGDPLVEAAQPAASAEPVPVPWQDVVKAIHAVRAEAARRGEMFPQTSDDRAEDRAAVHRVTDMIKWYATEGGAVAMKLPNWPTYAAPVDAQPSVPVPPTPEMIKAFQQGFLAELHKNDRRRTMTAEEAGLRAMLAAAPTPSAAGQAQQGDNGSAVEACRSLSIDIKNAHTIANFVHGGGGYGPINALHKAIDVLAGAAQQDADKVDADRYRWLRNGGISHSTDIDVVDDEGTVLTGEYLDEAVDTARAKQGGQS